MYTTYWVDEKCETFFCFFNTNIDTKLTNYKINTRLIYIYFVDF